MTLQTEKQAGRTSAPKTKSAVRAVSAGLAAAFLLSCSPIALHAETSNAELAREIAELKAQIRSMKGSISEVRRTKRTTIVAAPAFVPPPAFASIPAGATPVYATVDKKMIFGNLTITPGGYVDMNNSFRNRTTFGETITNVNAIPTNNLNAAHVPEDRLSARNTRVALLIESPIAKNFLVAGYGELDFRAAGTTSSPGQTNNFVPRIRQLYMTLDNNDYGMHFLAGQAWSLVTANSKGITPRNEVIPPTLDNIVLPGFDYSRTPQVRLVKDFNKKLWIGLSLENPQTAGLTTGACNGAVNNTGGAVAAPNITANGTTGVAGGTCVGAAGGNTDFGGTGTSSNVSFNRIPNVVGKIAYEARIADRDVHVEALGIYKNAVDYVNYSGTPFAAAAPAAGFPFSTTKGTNMGGVGGNIVLPVVVGKLDFQAGGEYGTGLGYYTSTGLPDATVGADGKIRALRGESAYAGVIAHVTPAIDLYAYAGIDQVQRNFSQVGTAQVGYGAINGVSNAGCNVIGGACAGATHRVWQLTGGFTDKLYKGYFGEIRASMQYSYTKRDLFSGTASATGPTAANPIRGASADDNVVMTSLRYFPFQ